MKVRWATAMLCAFLVPVSAVADEPAAEAKPTTPVDGSNRPRASVRYRLYGSAITLDVNVIRFALGEASRSLGKESRVFDASKEDKVGFVPDPFGTFSQPVCGVYFAVDTPEGRRVILHVGVVGEDAEETLKELMKRFYKQLSSLLKMEFGYWMRERDSHRERVIVAEKQLQLLQEERKKLLIEEAKSGALPEEQLVELIRDTTAHQMELEIKHEGLTVQQSHLQRRINAISKEVDPSRIAEAMLAEFEARRVAEESLLTKIKEKYGPDHPDTKATEARIAQLNEQIPRVLEREKQQRTAKLAEELAELSGEIAVIESQRRVLLVQRARLDEIRGQESGLRSRYLDARVASCQRELDTARERLSAFEMQPLKAFQMDAIPPIDEAAKPAETPKTPPPAAEKQN
jgi:hypothetical protein